MSEKAKVWVGVLYPENMIVSWQDDLADIVQLPFAYCIHDKDLLADGDETRKVHLHLILVWNGPTTYNNALKVFNKLAKGGSKCCNKIEAVISIRRMYDYLIHDTDECRKKGKYQYLASERVCGNNFDIGCFEQVSILDKEIMLKEMCNLVYEQNFCNFMDFYLFVVNNYDSAYFGVLKSYSGFIERLTKAQYQKRVAKQKGIIYD